MLNSDSKTINSTLQKYWGYPSLREFQNGPVQSLVSGQDTVALLPTGGGKSICYQVPAIIRGGLCIVISPLIALMDDQCSALKKLGLRAAFISGSIGAKGIDRVLENAAIGKLDFLYMSPERIKDAMFQARHQRMDVRTIAIDEAHCISGWGHDFRPEFRNIVRLRSMFPEAAFGAYTATATNEVMADIATELEMADAAVFKASSRRPNLSYHCSTWGDPDLEVLKTAKQLNLQYPKDAGLIYVRSRAAADLVAQRLISLGLNAASFHAGLSANEKESRQRSWINGKTSIMACTSAFGMGIDKANVRWVLHLGVSPNLENYIQEAGRAGRDGNPSTCILFHNPNSESTLRESSALNYPPKEFIKDVYQCIANLGSVAIGDQPEKRTYIDSEAIKDKLNCTYASLSSALRLLSLAGYIEIKEHRNSENTGTARWLGGRYRVLNEENSVNSDLRDYLQRSSTSSTTNIHINTKSISKILNYPEEKILLSLTSLDAQGAIEWIPDKGGISISWIAPRAEASNIVISSDIYEDRKALISQKLNSMIDYANSTSCKSSFIELYFDGSTPSKNCGVCDSCTFDELNAKTEVSQLIKSKGDKGIDSYELIRNFPPGNRKQIAEILRKMLDSDEIFNRGAKVFLSFAV